MIHAVYWFLAGEKIVDKYSHGEHLIDWAENGVTDELEVHCTDGKTYYHAEFYFEVDNYNQIFCIRRDEQ